MLNFPGHEVSSQCLGASSICTKKLDASPITQKLESNISLEKKKKKLRINLQSQEWIERTSWSLFFFLFFLNLLAAEAFIFLLESLSDREKGEACSGGLLCPYSLCFFPVDFSSYMLSEAKSEELIRGFPTEHVDTKILHLQFVDYLGMCTKALNRPSMASRGW